MISWLIATALILLAINGCYYLLFAGVKKPEDIHPDLEKANPFTILICAKNERPNLKKNLQSWLNQLSPDDRLLIVDDGSQDGSSDWLSEIAAGEKRLSTIRIEPEEKHHPGKKQALKIGLEHCKTDSVILTDADCRPHTANWAKIMNQSLNNYDVVIGFSPLLSGTSWVSRFAALESILVAMQYGSFAFYEKPYMFVGRNVAYRKDIVQRHRALDQHKDLLSGDDDLTLQVVNKYVKSGISLQSDALVWSKAPASFNAFFRQKSRHISTSTRYDNFSKIALGVFAGSHIGFYLLLIILIFNQGAMWVPSLLILRPIIILPAWYKWTGYLLIPFKWWKIMFFDLLLTIYYLIMSTTLIKKQQHWT